MSKGVRSVPVGVSGRVVVEAEVLVEIQRALERAVDLRGNYVLNSVGLDLYWIGTPKWGIVIGNVLLYSDGEAFLPE